MAMKFITTVCYLLCLLSTVSSFSQYQWKGLRNSEKKERFYLQLSPAPSASSPSTRYYHHLYNYNNNQPSFSSIGNERKVSPAQSWMNRGLLLPLFFMLTTASCLSISPSFAGNPDLGANDRANSKILQGGASTLQQGIAKSITRGVNLDGSDFHGLNLKGVAFQQSIIRDANFAGSNLYSASFFDATLDGSNFEGADLTLANVELAQFKRVNFKNAILKEMYVVGTTNFEGVNSIENTDWTDTDLRKDQRKYLCNHPTAKGVNPTTGADTRESLLCELVE